MKYFIMFKFTKNEIKDLIIAFIVISLSFAILYSRRNFNAILYFFPIAMVGVGTGFILHELGHKIAAMKYGYWAEFKLSIQGLLLALITSFVGFVFAAPGAVYIYGQFINDEENGIISFAGPIVNIALAFIFLIICTLIYPYAMLNQSYALTFVTCSIAFGINSFLAVFNLLPIGNLDGNKILRWNGIVWVIMIAIAGGLTAANMTYGTENIVRILLGI